MAEALRAKAGTILVVNRGLLPLNEIVAYAYLANFVVLRAYSEVQAVKLVASLGESIDLLLADSKLLGRSRLSLPNTLRQARPDLQVMLFCGDIVIGSFGCALISNPFNPAKLLDMIHAVLHPAEESQLTRSAGSAGVGCG